MISSIEDFQQSMKGLIHDGNIKNLRITFTEADGSTRSYQCSLVEESSSKFASQEANSTTVSTFQSLFDTNCNQWRTFKWERVI